MKLISKNIAKALLIGVCGISALVSADAATYTWRGTNSTAWGTPGNWSALSVGPTGAGGIGHRLDINNQTRNECVYDASLGTTIYGGTGIRGIVIGSGAGGSGTFTVTGGTFITTNTSTTDLLQNTAGNTGILNVNGGTFISGSPDFGVGLGTGTTIAFLNVNSGSATMGRILANIGSATFNYNGGTMAFSNITVSAGSITNNFNGGTVKPKNNSTAFIPSAVVANVRNGGAIFDSAGFNITVVPSLRHSVIGGDAAIDGGLTKNGAGTLTLNNLPAYTGPTRVNTGQLIAPLPTASTALVVADGARFTPALTNRPWMVDSAALTNATVDFNYVSFTANPDTNAAIYVTNLAISGSVTCNVSGAGFPVTNITLLSYGTKTGGGSFVLGSLPPGAVATLNDDGANVTLDITAASVQSLIWSVGDGLWQTNGAANWNSGSATYLEYPSGVNDMVTFNDTASGTVNINSQVNPSSTTIDVTSGFYTFSGAGSIGGTNGIAKSGTSTLTINNSNNFIGPVTVSGGTLFVNNPDALGATNGMVTVNGPANTLEIGAPFGNGIAVSNKSVTINGTGVGGSRGALRGASVAAGQTNIWAGPVVIGTDLSRIGTEDSGNLVVAGNITDNGANLGLILRQGTGGTLTIASTGNTYGYTRTFGDATLGALVLGVDNAFSTNRLDLGTGIVDMNGFNQTVTGVQDYSGLGTIINNGAVASTLTINSGTNTATSHSTAGSLVDGVSVLNLVKTGKGTQTFSGANVTFSGTTTITDGRLNLTSINPLNTAITVGSGGTLGGEAATTNSLTLQANAILAFDPSTTNAFTADTINATASPINVLLSTTVTNDAFVLNTVNGITGSAANFVVVGARGGSFYLTNGNTQLMFSPSAVNADLVWKGNNGVNPTFWDTITTTNWLNGVTPDLFYAGDNVTFDDSASSYTVAITGSTVQPSSVTVVSSNNYSFSGNMGGGGAVTKGGTGTLTFASNNSYTGPTVITNGVLSIGTSTALGTTASGTTISDSGSLDLNTSATFANTINLGAEVLTISGDGFGGQGAIVNNSPVLAPQINAVQQIVMANNASVGGSARWDIRGTANALDMGAFTLTKLGGNQITLVGTTVNNPGNIVVNGGIFSLEVSANLNGSSANTMTVNNGGALNFYQCTGNPAWSLVINSGGTLSATSGNGAQNHWIGPVTLNGAATLNANGGHIYVDGVIAGAGSIVKEGPSGATLSGANSYAGNTTVNVGILNLLQPSLAVGSTVTITTNGALNLNYVGTNTVAALVLNGVSQPNGIYDAITGVPYITGTGALQVGVSAPTLNFTNTGSTLDFSWTGSFKLQVQTNSLNVGISTNWSDYPGGGSSPVSVPVDAANGSVFFRLSTP